MLRQAASRLAQPIRAAVARPAVCVMAQRGYADDANLLKTALYDYHIANGGKMVSVTRSLR